ncbi:hypothetical protein AOQ84DRAFT_422608 [Glonium stellatum]|uniref:Uncharacterized protein n=1 Tax=Glonium stellatum TaxID=574774 RepID=A0A8E2EQ19_9PEZI|nr:hypothetical protein AOQ84DRAFT_422608 [Glonium stellatum]
MDKASQELTRTVPEGESKSFRARADRSDKDEGQRYLYPWEENALVRFDAFRRSICMTYLPLIAFSLASQWPPANRPSKPSYRNWP